ncbi:MAG: hypothetical protein IJZ34_12560, partial [Lachnospiraceae bacterium]|nr:hypothetical protein [Lachnospiraceae bacterium]
VRHAASVHPDPGSNSHVKKFACQLLTGFIPLCHFWSSFLKFTVFWVVIPFRLALQPSFHSSLVLDTIYSHLSEIIQSCLNCSNNLFSWNIQGCITVYLSRYFVVSQAYRSATAYLDYHILLCLSTTFFIFFQLFSSFRSESVVLPDNECEYITLFDSCQHLFLNYFNFFDNSTIPVTVQMQENITSNTR